MKALRNYLFFFVGFFFSAYAVLSYAGQYPSVVNYTVSGVSGTYLSASGACAAWAATEQGITAVYDAQANRCGYTFSGNYYLGPYVGSSNSCPGGGSYGGAGLCIDAPDCTSGQTRDQNGICVTSCPAAGASGSPTGQTFTGSGSFPSTLCIGGCSYNWTGVGVQAGNTWAVGAGRSLGQNCSTNNATQNLPPENPVSKCVSAGQGWGNVNGVVVCTPPEKTVAKTETKQGPKNVITDPNALTPPDTKTETETLCEGEVCTTKKTITSPAPGGGSQKEETQTTQPKADYCKDNPKVKQCSGQEQSDYCEKNPEALSCMKAGTPAEEGALQTVDKSIISSITPVSIGGSGGCPAPITLPKGLSYSFQPTCDFVSAMKPIVLISAWILAGMIVFGMASKS